MKFWARTFKDNRMTRDMVITNTEEDTRTHKVFAAIEKIGYDFDIARPIWLDSNISDFKRYSKVRFYQDSFIEEVPFDYLEFSVLEED
ncbi:MAG: hypothetical protein E7298_08080 [Lachnospiraceae bacterium]|nr:hypothetical protein [Lachnospiraceae bacterium]MBQ6319428.1 hypothetical protein [Lachnospiraceae bacterium]MBQ8665761.1 hypothetical protein [Lachnospiraceae bacterium]